MTVFCHHITLPLSLNGVPAPFQRRCLALSTAEVMAEYPIQTVVQLLGAKKEAGTSKPAPAEIFIPLKQV